MTRTFALLTTLLTALATLASAEAQERAPTPATTEGVEALQKTVIETIAKVEDSVVALARVRKDGSDRPMEEFDLQPGIFPAPLPETRSVRDPMHPEFTPQEYGTGVVIDADGLIVTAYHVLGDIPKNDYYIWSKRRPFKATVLAADPWLDLAVLKIETTKLKPIKFGDAKNLKKGQFVIALGNPHGIAKDGEVSAKWGIVSNLQRSPAPMRPRSNVLARESLHHYGSLIETDALLVRGTSGGALVTLSGEMIGLTTTYAAREDTEAPAGLAIPVDQAFKDAVDKLKTGRKAEFGFLGVGVAEPTELARRKGAVVDRVVYGTPAAEMELQPYVNGSSRPYDVITQVEGEEIQNPNHMMMVLGRMPAQKKVRLTVERVDPSDPTHPRTLNKTVVLSKKYMDALRPVYASVVDPPWRGLTVDFVTATADFHLRAGSLDPDGCVAVIEVERNSPAWKAGLRPGMYISHVDDKQVKSPDEFQRLVANKTATVKATLTERVDNKSVVNIAAP